MAEMLDFRSYSILKSGESPKCTFWIEVELTAYTMEYHTGVAFSAATAPENPILCRGFGTRMRQCQDEGSAPSLPATHRHTAYGGIRCNWGNNTLHPICPAHRLHSRVLCACFPWHDPIRAGPGGRNALSLLFPLFRDLSEPEAKYARDIKLEFAFLTTVCQRTVFFCLASEGLITLKDEGESVLRVERVLQPLLA